MLELDQVCAPGAGEIQGTLNDEEVVRVSTLLKALAHPVRLRIVDLIKQAGGDLCVCEFESYFELKQPTISHHLKILRDAGLIHSRQDGTWVRHSIDAEVLATVEQLLSRLSSDIEHA